MLLIGYDCTNKLKTEKAFGEATMHLQVNKSSVTFYLFERCSDGRVPLFSKQKQVASCLDALVEQLLSIFV